jgi:hypothetical protein
MHVSKTARRIDVLRVNDGTRRMVHAPTLREATGTP